MLLIISGLCESRQRGYHQCHSAGGCGLFYQETKHIRKRLAFGIFADAKEAVADIPPEHIRSLQLAAHAGL